MTGTSESAIDQEALQVDTFPDGLMPGSTVLLAGSVDPTTYAIGLRALCQYGHSDESALVVTTTESADQTLDLYETVCSDADRASLGFVDTNSEQQYVPAIYGEIPTVYTPSPTDLERLVIALSDLTGSRLFSSGTRHLLVRSLTPLLENTSTARVCNVLERITGLRTASGLSLLGFDATTHDEETIAELTQRVDGVLWVTQPSRHEIEFELRTTSSHRSCSLEGGDDDG